jgi:hypothetical protein
MSNLITRMKLLPYKKGDPIPQIDFSNFDLEENVHHKDGNWLFTSNEGIIQQVSERILRFPLEEEFNIMYFALEE